MVVIGTPADDVLIGTDDATEVDLLLGLSGNDLLSGFAGTDFLLGGDGIDFLVGGDGNDELFGGDDNDQLFGGDDNDDLTGGVGNDIMEGGNGSDTFRWFDGDGSDEIDGGSDARGDDRDSVEVTGAEEGDLFRIGPGEDDLQFERTNLGQFRLDIEEVEGLGVTGGGGNDTLTLVAGFTAPTSIRSLRFDGGEGEDTLDGSAFSIPMEASGGPDADILTSGGGDDTLNGGDEGDTLNGGGGTDTLNGGFGVDTLNGGDFPDFLFGGGEDDTLDGGADNDELRGEGGNDTLTGGEGDDTFIYSPGEGNDTIADFGDGFDLVDFGAPEEEVDTVNDDLIDERDTPVELTPQGLVIDLRDTTLTLTGVAALRVADVVRLGDSDIRFTTREPAPEPEPEPPSEQMLLGVSAENDAFI